MLKPADPATRPTGPDEERPIGELVHQLVEDGKAYAQAEFGLVKTIASAKASRLTVPAIMLGAALLILQGGVNAFAVAFFLVILPPLGPLLAGILALLVFAAIAGGLGWLAIRKIRQEL